MKEKTIKKYEKIIESYKGIDKFLFRDLSDESKILLVRKTLKELSLLAEALYKGAGKKLLQYIENSQDKLSINNIESYILYGKPYQELDHRKRNIVNRLEIQQEFGHFSRIMNLDSLVMGGKISKDFDTVIDFSRFLELLIERKADRKETSLSTWGRATNNCSFSVINSPSCGLLYEEHDKNMVAILAVENPVSTFRPKAWLKNYSRLANRFGPKTSTLLFDYLLYLGNRDADTAFTTAKYSQSASDKIRLEVSGAGGCGVLLTTRAKHNPYASEILERMTLGNSEWSFGQFYQSEIEHVDREIKPEYAKVYCFHPNAWNKLQELDDKNFTNLLNKQYKNGWYNPQNSIFEYLSQNYLVDQVAMLTVKKSKGKPDVSSLKSPIFSTKALAKSKELKELLRSKKLVVESLHIHADRDMGVEQEDALMITKLFENLLSKKGYKGKLRHVSMIDDYHVVNRIDYKKFVEEAKKKNLKFEEIVLESSPLLRLVAADILRYLAFIEGRKENKLKVRGHNLYLEFPEDGISIELLSDMKTKPVIGCCLFDAALCLYKEDPAYYQKGYGSKIKLLKSKNIHDVLLKYYRREKNPSKRKRFLEKFFEDLPPLVKIQKEMSKTIKHHPKKIGIVNVLAEFYRPQQKKVNKLLGVLGRKPIYSLYYNSATKDVYLEKSSVV